MNEIVIKNIIKKKPSNTTITVKVTEDFKRTWNKWAFENNVNKSKTLQAVLKHIMENYNE